MNVEPPSTANPATKQLDADMAWYRAGRNYVMLLTAAAEAFAANDQWGGSGKEEAADNALWQLDRADADQVRDFIAGVHREAQARLRELASNGWCPTEGNAAPAASASTAGDAGNPKTEGTESLYGPAIVVHRALVDMALHDLADPEKRLGAFGYLGIGDHENRVLKARSLDEGTGYDTLVGVHNDIALALDQADAEELGEFIRGTQHAHLSDLG